MNSKPFILLALISFVFISAKPIKQDLPHTNSKIVQFCKANLNRKVSTGECWDLVEAALNFANADWSSPFLGKATLLETIFFFSSETIITRLFPGFYNVEIWLFFTGFGLIAIFVLVFLSYCISLMHRALKRRKLRALAINKGFER